MPEPAAAAHTPVVVSLSPDVLDRHPLNPRPPISKDERLAELVESLRVHGQKQPCVVIEDIPNRDGPRYRIVIGHRRAAACKELGREVLCIVEDLDDDAAVAIMLSDNEVRTDVDPFLEAKAVGVLLARPGWTLQSVGEALGKSDRWVARRANLANLRPAIRKSIEPRGWPLEWVEDLAKLDAAAQDSLSSQDFDRVENRDDLNHILSEHLQLLGKAPWSLEDETLVPKAGSCAACPKTSLRAPGLFDAGEDVENPKAALRVAVCRDSTCWERKRAAWYERLASEAAAGGKKVVKFTHYGAIKNPPAFVKPLPQVESYAIGDAVKKEAPGAVLALELDYEGNIKGHRWVKDPAPKGGKKAAAAAGATPKVKEAPAAERLEASKERIAKRREAYVDLAFKDNLLDWDQPPADTVLAFAAAFEVPRPLAEHGSYPGAGLSRKEARERFELCRTNEAELYRGIWERVRKVLADNREPWMAEVLGIDLKAFAVLAKKEIPDPKSWKSLEAQVGKVRKNKDQHAAAVMDAAKRKGKKARKKAPVADTLDDHTAPAGAA